MRWVLILLLGILLFGCVGSLKPTDEELKACSAASDCSIEYGVWYNQSCWRGCFNSEKAQNALASDPCRGTRWEVYPENASCGCAAGKCELRGG